MSDFRTPERLITLSSGEQGEFFAATDELFMTAGFRVDAFNLQQAARRAAMLARQRPDGMLAPDGHEFYTNSSKLLYYGQTITSVSIGTYEGPLREPEYPTTSCWGEQGHVLHSPKEVEIDEGFEFAGSRLALTSYNALLIINGDRGCRLPMPPPDPNDPFAEYPRNPLQFAIDLRPVVEA